MKQLSLLLASALAVSLLAGCGSISSEDGPRVSGSDDLIVADSSLPAPVPVPAEPPALPPEPPILDWLSDVEPPAFLDSEQQDLYLRACTAAQFLFCNTAAIEQFPLANGSRLDPSVDHNYQTVEMNGAVYTVSQGRYSRWDDFQTMMDSLFTPELQQKLLHPNGRDTAPVFAPSQEGALCFQDGARGSNMFYDLANIPDRFEEVSRSEAAIEFTLIGHYADLEETEDGQEKLGPVYTQEFPMRLERTPDGWRFAEFHIPY